jgi:hypothetical protein
MKDNYDFTDAVKNPFAGKINGKYNVTVYYDNKTETYEYDKSVKPNTTGNRVNEHLL